MARMGISKGGSGKEAKKPPLLLGRFEVGKLLGQGNFAKVYHARNVATGEEVAIKVMEKEKIFKSGLTAHIKREIAVLRRVRHPHIVQLYEVMATKLRIYFVMEYVRGGELFARVARGRLPEADARRYFQQLVSAVAFCHARGVFHRDIKPENLLVDDAGDLKVSDFGLSAVADGMRRDGLFHTFCGTPAYVAPEVLSRRGYDAAGADLWSCGVVLFVLMAGYLPFQDRNLAGMYRKIHKGDFRCPKWFSPELIRLLRGVLVTNPQRRATAEGIMENEWFKIGFRRFSFRVEDDRTFTCFELDDDAAVDAPTSPPDTPRTVDSGDVGAAPTRPRKAGSLTSIPEQQKHTARFVSAAPVEVIVATLEAAAAAAGMAVREREDGSISMEGTREGEHGALAVAAEIYELTPELVVVEVRRKAGGAAEYEEFFRARLKPSLRELVCDDRPCPEDSGELSRSL
ncbi:Os01g0206300 [Oryza sativa Japonica Group]|nr:Os01g0206300 [Oryza sativa Japonica Group]|eukprot:NP_001042344.2 Os01g0206300 [Oryza sativa Japonica Group]